LLLKTAQNADFCNEMNNYSPDISLCCSTHVVIASFLAILAKQPLDRKFQNLVPVLFICLCHVWWKSDLLTFITSVNKTTAKLVKVQGYSFLICHQLTTFCDTDPVPRRCSQKFMENIIHEKYLLESYRPTSCDWLNLITL